MKVKPLIFDLFGSAYYAKTGVLEYIIHMHGIGCAVSFHIQGGPMGLRLGNYGCLEAGKRAAQEHFDAFIMAQIENT